MQNKKILDYTLLRPLGKGGMAEVWYAENDIEKPAAVKILNADLALNETIVERFRNEARIMVKLNHPNIRQVYSYASLEGRPCIVMEYLEGDDLAARMKRGEHFTDEQLRKWWNQLVSALNYTHGEGVVHRDIKPSNIFVTDKGEVKLLDFGIAKVRDSIVSTHTGAMMGTLMYMSPEQVRDSKHIDHKTDLYSLAVTFVHLLTGRAPYDRDTIDDYEIRKNIVETPLVLDGVPAQWRAFLRPYLAKKPEERPLLREFSEVADAAAMPQATVVIPASEKTVVSGATVAETPSTQPQPQPRSRKVWPWVVAAVAVALVAILAMRGCGGKKSADENGGQTAVADTIMQQMDSLVEAEEAAPATEEAEKPEVEVPVVAPTPTPVQPAAPTAPAKPVPAGYVDLGLSVYWKNSNEWNSADDHGFYTYDDAKSRFGSRLPTKAQLEELVDECTWTWSDSKKGYYVKGPSGNSIFLPAAGYRGCFGDVGYVGSDGDYWSSTPGGTEGAWELSFGSGGHYVNGSYRCFGQSVRLVQGK